MPFELSRYERQIAALFISAYALLTFIFSLAPILEGPDDRGHYLFIYRMLETRALPDPTERLRSELHQPPLYYMLHAPVAAALGNPAIELPRNPSFGFEIGAVGNDNKNQWLHSRVKETFPYSASRFVLSSHVMFVINVVMGAITLAACYGIFWQIWPDRPDKRLLALGVVAGWPQMMYRFSTLNNDNGVIMMASVCLWLLLRLHREGPTLQRAVWLGLALGAALLMKVNAALLALPVGVVVVMDFRRMWKYAIAILAIVFAVASWWYFRNWVLYGDPTAMGPTLQAFSEDYQPGALGLNWVIHSLPFAYANFWARFANNVIPVDLGIYQVFDLFSLASLIGAVIMGIRWIIRFRKGDASPASGKIGLIMMVFTLSWVAFLIYFASTAYFGSQGRYLLPGAAGWAALIAFGFDAWTPVAHRFRVALSVPLVMMTLSCISLFGYYLPAFQPLPAQAEVEASLFFQYEGSAELIGMSPAQPTAHPGETITITLTWRAIKPTATSLSAFLHSIETDLVRRDSIPGTGNLLSTEWLPGETWSERYIVPIPDDTEPGTYTLIAGLYDREANHTLNPVDANGNSTTPVIGQLVIVLK